MNTQFIYSGPSIIPDSDKLLIEQIVVIIKYSDPEYILKIYVNNNEIIGHITVSNKDFRQDIIDNLLYLNKKLKVRVKYSSSLKISKLISFSIKM